MESAAVHLKEDTQPVKCPNCFKPFLCYRAMREHWIRCTRKLHDRRGQDEIPTKRSKLRRAATAQKQVVYLILPRKEKLLFVNT